MYKKINNAIFSQTLFNNICYNYNEGTNMKYYKIEESIAIEESK